MGDRGAGEGVGDAEVEVLMEVREGVRMDREGAGRLGRDDSDQVRIGPDQVHDDGKMVGNEDGAGVDVLADQRAVRCPDGIAGLFREVLAGRDQGGLDRAHDGAGIEVQRVPARGSALTAEETAELEKVADSLELNVIRFWEKEMK